MSNDLTKRTDPTKPERQKSNDAASRLKRELMADALDRVFGADAAGRHRRGSQRLGLERRARNVTPSVGQYLAARTAPTTGDADRTNAEEIE